MKSNHMLCYLAIGILVSLLCCPVVADYNKWGSSLAISAFRSGTWYVDHGLSRSWGPGDVGFRFGSPGDQPINYLGFMGVFRNGQWIIDADNNKQWSGTGSGKDLIWNFGMAGDLPVLVDYGQKLAVFRNGKWYVDMNDNKAWNSGDATWSFGMTGDIPVYVDGHIGVFRKGKWYIDMNDNKAWNNGDATWSFGMTGDIPVYVDGHIGVFRKGKWYMDMDNNRAWNNGDATWSFGMVGDRPCIASAFTYNVVDNNMMYKANAARMDAKLPLLSYDNNLYMRAVAHSNDMFAADNYFHGDAPVPGGQNVAPCLEDILVSYPCISGYHYVFSSSPDSVASAIMHMYMDHDFCGGNGHRNNILNAAYGKMGFGTVCGTIGGYHKCYNTQNFGYAGYDYSTSSEPNASAEDVNESALGDIAEVIIEDNSSEFPAAFTQVS
jgi:hypothetical protein